MKLFCRVAVDHMRTTEKLRYFISHFEKHIQTRWIYIFFYIPLESFRGCKLSWLNSVSSGAKENWYAFLEVIDYLSFCLETSWKKCDYILTISYVVMKAWTYMVHRWQAWHSVVLQKWFFAQAHCVSSSGVQFFTTSNPKNRSLECISLKKQASAHKVLSSDLLLAQPLLELARLSFIIHTRSFAKELGWWSCQRDLCWMGVQKTHHTVQL